MTYEDLPGTDRDPAYQSGDRRSRAAHPDELYDPAGPPEHGSYSYSHHDAYGEHGEHAGYGDGDGDGQHDHHDGYDDHDGRFYDDADDWPVVDDPSPVPSRGGRRRDRSGSGHPVLKALAVLTVLVLVVVGGGLVWAQQQIDPGGRLGPTVSVVIPAGSSTSQIGSKLASAGVIHNATLFALYVHLHGDTLLPGTYALQRNSPYSSAIDALRRGPTLLTEKLVIPEGYTLAQIADAVAKLPHLGLSAQKFLAAAGNTVRSPYEPSGSNNLEGLLFPATYDISQGQTEVDVLEKMVGAFNDQASSLGLSAAAAKLGLTPYQLVIVASIVEREAKLPGDRGNVASVIYNRLKIGMKLGADSTQAYYLRLTNPAIVPTAAQDDQPSPYNTRLNAGLPPTPIANPGVASLQAATNPPTTKYLYWVEINPDGQLGFASTDAGFVQLQQQCRAAGLC